MKKPNQRRCISCRQVADKEEFWRVVRVYPSHQVQLDKGMGRSAYLCRAASCLTAAQKKNRLGRSLKAPVPLDIYERLWQRLSEAAADPETQPTVEQPPQPEVGISSQTRSKPPTVR